MTKSKNPQDSTDKFGTYVAYFLLILFCAPPLATIFFATPITKLIAYAIVIWADLLLLLCGLIVCKKNFRIRMRRSREFEFDSWEILVAFFIVILVIGGLIFFLVYSGYLFEELRRTIWDAPSAYGLDRRKYSPLSVLHIVSLLFLMITGWVFLVFEDTNDTPAFQKKRQKIDKLYKKAFKKQGSFALHELINMFNDGHDHVFFKQFPIHAAKVFEGAQLLEHLVENGQEYITVDECYQLGLMYEIGFACKPIPAKAIEYYKRAQTAPLEIIDRNRSQSLRQKAKSRLQKLQQP